MTCETLGLGVSASVLSWKVQCLGIQSPSQQQLHGGSVLRETQLQGLGVPATDMPGWL